MNRRHPGLQPGALGITVSYIYISPRLSYLALVMFTLEASILILLLGLEKHFNCSSGF